jgi:HEAT-like repeat
MPPLRETLAGLIVRKDYPAALELVRSQRRAMRALMGLLFHEDALTRWRTVSMFGRLAVEEPELLKPHLFKLYYSLSEESSIVGWASAQAIGEIARLNPELAKEVIKPVVHFMDDDEVSLPDNRNTVQLAGTIWTVGNIAEAIPDLARETGPRLELFLGDPDDEVRGLAVWAICRMGRRPRDGILEKMLDDRAAVDIYFHDELKTTTVGLLAGKALDRIIGTGRDCL